jgi:hypothetical protein
MNRILAGLVLITALAAPVAAYGDTVNTFDLTGTLASGGTMEGSFLIDTTLGEVTGGNFTVERSGVTYTDSNLINQSWASYPAKYIYDAIFSGSNGSVIQIVFLTTNLSTYAGGGICDDAHYCGGFETTFETVGNPFDNVADGTITPAGPVPEPSSLELLGTGIVGSLVLLRRKLFN